MYMYWQIETLQSQINFNMQLGRGKELKDDPKMISYWKSQINFNMIESPKDTKIYGFALFFKLCILLIFSNYNIDQLFDQKHLKIILILCNKEAPGKRDLKKFMYICCKSNHKSFWSMIYFKCLKYMQWQTYQYFFKRSIILLNLLTNSVWICAPCVVKSRGCCWQTEQAWKIYKRQSLENWIE